MAALPLASAALDPDAQERYLRALERMADKADNVGMVLAHQAGFTKDEDHRGLVAVGILATLAYLRLRVWYRAWSNSAVGKLLVHGDAGGFLPSLPSVDWGAAEAAAEAAVKGIYL